MDRWSQIANEASAALREVADRLDAGPDLPLEKDDRVGFFVDVQDGGAQLSVSILRNGREISAGVLGGDFRRDRGVTIYATLTRGAA